VLTAPGRRELTLKERSAEHDKEVKRALQGGLNLRPRAPAARSQRTAQHALARRRNQTRPLKHQRPRAQMARRQTTLQVRGSGGRAEAAD
jgi:hypothetical protein